MKYFYSRFNSALSLLKAYNYPQPFHLYLKEAFKKEKKFGSKDRKAIAELCFRNFRTALLFKHLPPEQALLLSSALLGEVEISAWNQLANQYNLTIQLNEDFNALETTDKMKLFSDFSPPSEAVFYPPHLLSAHTLAMNSMEMLHFRPSVWLRNIVLSNEELELRHLKQSSLVKDAYYTDNVQINVSYEVQIQDLSSQYLCDLITIKEGDKVWDCCCGAAGKSLNLMDTEADFYLSDIRSSILQNAKQRLAAYYRKAKSYASINLQEEQTSLLFGDKAISDEYFDVILADLPCSGSGTWFRNPEHFSNFNYDELEQYVERQKSIVRHALPFLKTGGQLVYMTCSVFKSENEEMLDFILKNFNVQLLHQELFLGLEHRSDAMYIAILSKN